MSRRTLSMILLATVALLFAGATAATAAKPVKKKLVTRTVVKSPPQPPETQTGSRSQGM
jgi:hypothetical protein